MKRLATTILAVVGLAGCFDDPTSSLRNGPSRLRLSASQLFVAPAESVVVTGFLLDDQGNPIPGQLSFTSGDPTIARAGDLPADTLPGRMESAGYVVGAAGGQTYVRVTVSGVMDSIRVVTVPVTFTGTVSPATANVGDTITVTVPAGMVFDVANAAVTVGGVSPWITNVTTTSVSFLAPTASAAGTVVSVEGLVFLGSIAMPALDATTTVTIADPQEPANDAPASATAIAMPANVGDVVTYWGSLDDSDIDDYWVVTPANSGTYQVEVFWANTTIDIDAYFLNAAGGGYCVLDGCAGGTGADPEVVTVVLVGGVSYNIEAFMYDTQGEPVPEMYRLRITRQN